MTAEIHSPQYPYPGVSPGFTRDQIALAASWLREARRPVCVAGRGAVWSRATPQLLTLTEVVGRIFLASTPLAKGVVPENHPRAIGPFGYSGQPGAARAVGESDVLLLVGTQCLEQSGGHHPRLRHGRVIRVDHDPKHGRASSDKLFLYGDARRVLDALLTELGPADGLETRPNPFRAVPVYSGATSIDRHVMPQAIMREISRIAPKTPVAFDAGHSACWAVQYIERNYPGEFFGSLDWGTMGAALPTALGIAWARKAPAIALTGDGSIAMSGGDLHTAVELELPVVVLILNDGGPGMVRSGCRAWFGPDAVPELGYRYKMNLAAYARAFGAHAEIITDIEHFSRALASALERETPTVLDIHVDPSAVPDAVAERVRGIAGPKAGGGMC